MWISLETKCNVHLEINYTMKNLESSTDRRKDKKLIQARPCFLYGKMKVTKRIEGTYEESIEV